MGLGSYEIFTKHTKENRNKLYGLRIFVAALFPMIKLTTNQNKTFVFFTYLLTNYNLDCILFIIYLLPPFHTVWTVADIPALPG